MLVFPLAAQAAGAGEKHMLTLGKAQREYYLFTPSAKTDAPLPLVVVLHGGGGSPEQVAESTGFSDLAEREHFLVAYPAGTGRVSTWNAGKCCGYAARTEVDDVEFIEAMLHDIRKTHKVNPARIYATGMSNGGMMAYRLACDMSSTFAAVAPVAGALNVKSCDGAGRPSLMIFHALDDKHVPYKGGYPDEGLRADFGRNNDPDASVAQAMQFWLKHDYCRNFPGHEKMDSYTRVTYFCAEDRHVVLYTLNNGGHSWPGGKKGRLLGDEPNMKVNATQEIWRFFSQHPPKKLF